MCEDDELADALDRIYNLERELEVLYLENEELRRGKKMSDENKELIQGGTVPQKREERQLVKAGFTFLPQTWEQLYSYAKEICNTEFTPKSMRGSPGAVLAAWQKGSEVGLPPMASLESIAVINGVTSIHSDGFWALVVSHPLCEWFKETEPAEALKQGFGECTIKRKGNPHPVTRRFTVEMAEAADLVSKDNWKKYFGRMLQQRARHLAADDAVPEATQGLVPSDVAQDYETRDVTPAEPIKTPQPLKETKPDERKREEAPSSDRVAEKGDGRRKHSVSRFASAEAKTEATAQQASAIEETPPEKQKAAPVVTTQTVPTEKSQEDLIAECLLWIESAPIDQLNADDNWLMNQVQFLKGIENQLKVLRPFNNRRQQVNAAK